MRALVIDLDDTAVDTSALRPQRERRDWKACARNLHQTIAFDGIASVLAQLRADGIKIGFVTTSVSFYAEKILQHHGLPYDCLIAWHDCSPRKPHPASILLCLSRLGCDPSEAIGIGDSAIDADAYNAAGVRSLGAGWSPALDRTAAWVGVIEDPNELLW